MRNGRIISRFLSRNFTNTSQASLFLRQNLHSHFSASCRQVSASPYLAGPRTPPLAREYASMAQESKPTESVSLIVDEISGLTLLEVADLTEVLRKKFDINEMPTMAVMMPGMGFGVRGAAKGGGAAKAEEKKAEKTAFDLKLEGGFDAGVKIKIIKEVRACTNLGLKEAKDLVEKAPTLLKKGVAKEEAEKIIEKMKEVGAKVTME
ncbi:uncharacterized protein LOC127804016 [Diospyros lotus]|uniref:uncharacterized protein LOC127804015 n=1 Tax=Diospyros lotus TaxID=55363 RepID=UPI0022548620|nr:uncharacterized protein LOC127804015 [Diospyros lotus]XP_052196682.1 uncharacterized protein LOC127804016 [Diospyros lotus]